MSDSKKTPLQLFLSTSLVGSMTIFSRIIGFIRDILFAYIFGNSLLMDAFLLAYQIGTYLKRLLADNVFQKGFTALISRHKHTNAIYHIQSVILGNLMLVLFFLGLCLYFLSNPLIHLYAPGFEKNANALSMTLEHFKILLPYILISTLTAYAQSILNSDNRFFLSSLRPIFLNIFLIITLLLIDEVSFNTIKWLSIAISIATIFECFILFTYLINLKLIRIPSVNFKNTFSRKLTQSLKPLFVIESAKQFSFIISTILASLLATGSISSLYYATRLSHLPIGVITISIQTILLPHLSKNTDKPEQFAKIIEWGLKMVLAIILPASISLLLLSEIITFTLFYRGEFKIEAVQIVSQLLTLLAPAIFFSSINEIFTIAFCSLDKMKKPLKISFIIIALQITFSSIFVYFFKIYGLVLSTTLSSFIHMILLYFLTTKEGFYHLNKNMLLFSFKVLISVSFMVLFLYSFQMNLTLFAEKSSLEQITHLLILCFGGLIIYLLSAFLLGINKEVLTKKNF